MPDLIYNVKLNLDKGSLGKIVEPSAEREVKSLEQQVRQLEEALERAGNESGNFNKNFKNTTKQAGANNKAFSSTNQLLFSFSDGVQDAAQFSQGLAQGMRAIGNNVGFTAELFANLITRVKDYNDNLTEVEIAQGKTKTVTSELKDSFFSAGGALLALNAALTIGQFIFNQFGKSAKEASGSVDDFISSSAELRAISDFDFLNIESLERQQDALNLLLPDIEALDKATNGLQRNNTILGRSYGSAASSAIGANEALVDQTEITQKLRDEFSGLTDIELKDLIDRVKDLNKELTLRRALFERDPLAKFIDAQARATQETLLLVDAGLKNKDALISRRNVLQGLIEVEKRSGLTTDESKAKYIELNKQLDAVNATIKEYNADAEQQIETDRKLAEEKKKLIQQFNNQQASINALNATITFGDATGTAVALALQHQIAISKLTEAMDAADDKQKSYYAGLIDAETDLAELRGTQLLVDTLDSFKPAGLINQFDELINRQGDAITSLATLLEAGFIDEETYANSILKLQDFVNTQEKILVSQTVGAVAKAKPAITIGFAPASAKRRSACSRCASDCSSISRNDPPVSSAQRVAPLNAASLNDLSNLPPRSKISAGSANAAPALSANAVVAPKILLIMLMIFLPVENAGTPALFHAVLRPLNGQIVNWFFTNSCGKQKNLFCVFSCFLQVFFHDDCISMASVGEDIIVFSHCDLLIPVCGIECTSRCIRIRDL